MERVVICLHVGSCETIKKVWRFDVNRITEYSRKKAESELVQLFPDIARKGYYYYYYYYQFFQRRVTQKARLPVQGARKGLKLKMWYLDDLAGEVSNTDNLVT